MELEEDKDYSYLSWPQIKEHIRLGHLEKLTRSPSQLRLYSEWCSAIRLQYGSVANFVLEERLHWTPITPSSSSQQDDESKCASDALKPPEFEVKCPTPYENREDYKILINDWPYGVAAGITHICVWLKTALSSNPQDGSLSDEGSEMTERFVQRHIAQELGLQSEDIAWFKNPFALQSIRFVDHVHVLLKDVDRAKLEALLDKP